MNSDELIKSLYRTEDNLKRVEEMMKLQLLDLTSNASFNSIEICNVVAKLVSIIEKQKYVPVNIFEQRNVGKNSLYVYYSCVVKEDKSCKCKSIADINELTSDDYFDVGMNTSKYNYSLEEGEHYFTYEFLLDKFNENYGKRFMGSFNYYEDVTDVDFCGHEYIKRFIIYLFDLQVKKRDYLSYREMRKAICDFLELERNKPKQKIKEKNKES